MSEPENDQAASGWSEGVVEVVKAAREDLLWQVDEVRSNHELPHGAMRLILREALHREIVREARKTRDAVEGGDHGEQDDSPRQS